MSYHYTPADKRKRIPEDELLRTRTSIMDGYRRMSAAEAINALIAAYAEIDAQAARIEALEEGLRELTKDDPTENAMEALVRIIEGIDALLPKEGKKDA